MAEFTLVTDSICIGAPVMGLARYALSLTPGHYTLEAGALKRVDGTNVEEDNLSAIDLDGPYLYVVDASKNEQFDEAFHEIGNECSYMMMEMQNRHKELETKVGIQIGFYWEEDLAGRNCEGKYVLDVTKVRRVQ